MNEIALPSAIEPEQVMIMNSERLRMLANLLQTLMREQKERSFEVFCLSNEDRISMIDAEAIINALKFEAGERFNEEHGL